MCRHSAGDSAKPHTVVPQIITRVQVPHTSFSCCRSLWLRRVASAAQLAAVAVLGWRFSTHMPTAWLLQTLAFVALNKVEAWPGKVSSSCSSEAASTTTYLHLRRWLGLWLVLQAPCHYLVLTPSRAFVQSIMNLSAGGDGAVLRLVLQPRPAGAADDPVRRPGETWSAMTLQDRRSR